MTTTIEAPVKANLPDYTGTEMTLIGEDKIMFVSIKHDSHAENPLDNDDYAGKIFSYGSNHSNFNYKAANEARAKNKNHVLLSYFEHGNCLWGTINEMGSRPGVEFTWDGVRLAGVWVPSKERVKDAPKVARKGKTEEEIKVAEAARRAYFLQAASWDCEAFTAWCNGECFGYVVEVFNLQKDADGDNIEEAEYYDRHAVAISEDSCWGFIGWDNAAEAAGESANYELKPLTPIA